MRRSDRKKIIILALMLCLALTARAYADAGIGGNQNCSVQDVNGYCVAAPGGYPYNGITLAAPVPGAPACITCGTVSGSPN